MAQEWAKEWLPPGEDLLEKVTPVVWILTVLIVGILVVLQWYLEAGSRLARTIDTIFVIAGGAGIFCLVGYLLLKNVRRKLDDDTTKQ